MRRIYHVYGILLSVLKSGYKVCRVEKIIGSSLIVSLFMKCRNEWPGLLAKLVAIMLSLVAIYFVKCLAKVVHLVHIYTVHVFLLGCSCFVHYLHAHMHALSCKQIEMANCLLVIVLLQSSSGRKSS